MATDAAKAASNWSAGMSQGAAKFRDKINAVSVHPGQLAAAQQALALANYTQAMTSGRWAAAVANYNLQNWKTITSGVGASNFVNGAQKGLSKYQAFAQAAAPKWAQISQQIRSMPKGGAANAKARVGAVIDFMIGLKGIGKAGH